MRNFIRRRLALIDGQDGLSLAEVIVAIFIIGILTTASVGFYFTGLNASTTEQRRDVAVTVANNTMEQVSSWSTSVDTYGLSALFKNRSAAAVTSLWAAGTTANVPGLAATYPVFDVHASSSSSLGDIPTVSSGDTTTVNGTTYTIQTFLGQCFEPLAGGTCNKVAGYLGATPPAVFTGVTPLVRAIVNVTWTAGCGATACSYQTTSLLDTKSDLQWKTNG